MDKLLEALLQMEHFDKEEATFQFNLTELNTFLTSLIRDYEPMTDAKEITVEIACDTAACLARIDTVEFARAIAKVMDNAIAYTPEGGSIALRTNIQGA
jgi:signal transduction histidine kinase